MAKNIKNVLIAIVVLIVIVGVIFFVGNRQNQSQSSEKGIILYYGDGCPHCANVDAFITENKVEEKVFFERKEVWKNPANKRSLVDKVAECGLSAEGMGVPFLWDGIAGKCLIGDVDIINFFKEKAGL